MTATSAVIASIFLTLGARLDRRREPTSPFSRATLRGKRSPLIVVGQGSVACHACEGDFRSPRTPKKGRRIPPDSSRLEQFLDKHGVGITELLHQLAVHAPQILGVSEEHGLNCEELLTIRRGAIPTAAHQALIVAALTNLLGQHVSAADLFGGER